MIGIWKTRTLGDSCEMYQPKTISAKDMTADGGYPVFGANGVIGRYHKFNHENPQLLITCRGATCGSINISAPKSWITGNAMVVRPKNGAIKMRFLEYIFRGGIDISRAITGAAQPQITRTNLAPLIISFPESIEEQSRIIGILDEAFAEITIAKANAEKNLHHSHEIFESFVQSIFTRGGTGWKEMRLGDFAIKVSTGPFGSLLHKSDYVDRGVPLVNPTNIVGDLIVPDPTKLIDDFTKKRLSAYVLEKDDIVVGRRGEIGRCAVIGPEQSGWVCGTGCFFVRPLPSTNPIFLASLIRSAKYRKKLEQLSTGSTMSNLSNTALGDLIITMPSLSEQQKVVVKFDAIATETQRLAALYSKKIEALDDLKKSFLHQAFTGQL
jgi:type I restriction enzyme, S subunit